MKKILEIGSGQGFNTYVLSKQDNAEAIGIDISKEDLYISKKRYPKIKFILMNAEKMNFNNDYFDEIYALDILEHVDNLGKVLGEVKRVLKKEGKFVVNIPHYNSEKWLIKLRPTYFSEIHHVRVFKNNQLDKDVLKRGFYIAKKEKRGFLQHIELFFLFKRKINSQTQVSIGSWRDNPFTIFVHIFMLYFDPIVFQTPFKLFPLWVFTLPVGLVISFLGNKYFPKSFYYEFIKK